MSLPAISVIVPTLGDFEKLQRLLVSAQKQKFFSASDFFEILVVVNGVKAGTLQKIDLLSEEFLKVIKVEEKGVNKARNAGLREARASILLFLDDDCEIQDPYFLARHIRFHAEHPAVFATGGGYQLPADCGRFDVFYNSIQMRWFFSGLVQPGQNQKACYLLGGNFSIKAHVALEQKLLFDERIKYGGSESEFFRKAGLLGLELRANSFEVLHHTHETVISLSRKLYKQGRGKALIDEKYPDTTFGAIAETDAGPQLFNYVFWWGYYSYRQEYLRIIPHLFKDVFGLLNVTRFRLLSGISKRLAEKKEKGDRF